LFSLFVKCFTNFDQLQKYFVCQKCLCCKHFRIHTFYYYNLKFKYVSQGEDGTVRLDSYTDDMHVQWRIESDCDNINIYTESFHLEHNYDHLSIQTDDWNRSYTGNRDFNLYTSGGNIELIFTSDGSVQEDGFVIHWQCIDIVPATTTTEEPETTYSTTTRTTYPYWTTTWTAYWSDSWTESTTVESTTHTQYGKIRYKYFIPYFIIISYLRKTSTINNYSLD